MSNTQNLKPFPKGNPGRPKGSPNKFTTLKQAFLDAFQQIGGVESLKAWAQKNDHNKAIFYQMVTRLFPQEVAHSGELSHVLEFKFGENGNGKEHE